jgi:nucleoside-diphosphate-sugar epimerase
MIHPKKNVKQFVEFIENKTFKEETCHIPNDNLKSLGWNIKKEFYEGIREVIQYFQIKKLENQT